MPRHSSRFAALFEWTGGYIGCATILSAVVGGLLGFGLGMLVAQNGAYHQQYLKEREAIEPILAGDPAFGQLRCYERSSGGVDLTGAVPTRADRDRLRERLVRVAGENRADELMLGVMVNP